MGGFISKKIDMGSYGVNQINLVENHESKTQWFEEELESDLKWSFAINRILHEIDSKYQNIVLMDTKPFGKTLVLDGKLQSAEKDEFIYHECLVHPPLLIHANPKRIFIMGGGEGSTAREILRHVTIENVVMCDIDKVVVDFCRQHLTANQATFNNSKFECVFNDAMTELKSRSEKFDVIIGDLCDPIEGGPCNHLYTKNFYENVIKSKLNHGGIFATQASIAGVLSHKEIFTSIYNTLKHVFKYVVAYTAHVPSYADTTAFVVASDEPIELDTEDLDGKIKERIEGELEYLDGETIIAATKLNKTLRTSLLKETHVFTEEKGRFIHGHGIA